MQEFIAKILSGAVKIYSAIFSCSFDTEHCFSRQLLD